MKREAGPDEVGMDCALWPAGDDGVACRFRNADGRSMVEWAFRSSHWLGVNCFTTGQLASQWLSGRRFGAVPLDLGVPVGM